MKHTYLCPLPPTARFLWRLGRADVADLFGYPDDSHQAGWITSVRLADEIDYARRTLRRITEDSPRVCIGQGYAIPGSLTENSGRHHAVRRSTADLTATFWDAPLVTARLAHEVSRTLLQEPGRDPVEEIHRFLTDHIGQPVIPVWM